MGHETVGLYIGGEGVELVEAEEAEADVEECGDDEKIGGSVEEDGFEGFLLGAGGHHALNGDLVGTIFLHELEKEGDGNDGEGEVEEGGGPVEDIEAAGGVGLLEDGGGAAFNRGGEGDGDPESTADEDEELEDVGPDDGGETAEGGVEGGDAAHKKDAGGEGEAGGGGEGEGGGVDDGAEPAEAAEDKEEGDGTLGADAEALADELVGGGDAVAVVVGIEACEDDGGDGEAGEGDGDEGNVFFVGGGRETDVGDGASEGCIHAHGDGEPGEGAAAEEKLVGTLGAAGEEPADEEHAEKIDKE